VGCIVSVSVGEYVSVDGNAVGSVVGFRRFIKKTPPEVDDGCPWLRLIASESLSVLLCDGLDDGVDVRDDA
jgi:hypothetical protein